MVARYRIACLRIPRFQIVVHRKDDISLKGKPFVIVKGDGARAEIFMCSLEAARRSVFPGMKLSQAEAVCADLVWRQHDEKLYRLAQKSLSQELIAASPKVTADEPGIFFLDAAGLKHLGGEGKFCRQIQKIAGGNGFIDSFVGIADTTFASSVASRFKRSRTFIIPSGEDALFLAPMSIYHLPISSQVQESMIALGLKTMGQITELPVQELFERFGKEGSKAYNLASGIDERYPSQVQLEKEIKCEVELGGPVELLNETQFVFKSMLNQITAQLKQEGLCAEELHLAFFNDDEKFDERTVKLLRPSNNSKFLLEVLKLSLEATPLKREYTGVSMLVSRHCLETWEQVGIESNEKKTPSLSVTLMLQRFVSRLGEDSVVRSQASDHYFPDKAGVWVPVTDDAPNSVLPLDINYVNAHTSPAGLACGLVLKKTTSPSPVLVELQGELPSSITYQDRWHRVKEITQPEKLSGLWWENPTSKSYYVALLEPMASKYAASTTTTQRSYLVLLVQDHERNSWAVEGFFD